MPAWEANTDKILNEDGSLTLEVKETYAIDLVPKKNPSGSRGIVRIDYAAGEAINLSWTSPDFLGDVVEIMGSRKTASLVSPLHKLDFGDDKQRPWRIFTKQKEAKRFIRMDAMARLNAGCKIGDRVSVRKIDVPYASKIVVTPDFSHVAFDMDKADTLPDWSDDVPEFLRKSLAARPLTEGDKIMVGPVGLVIEVNDVFEENDNAASGAKCNLCDKMIVGRKDDLKHLVIMHLEDNHPEFETRDNARIRRLFLIAEDGEDVKKIFGILHTRTSTARVSHDSIFEIKRPTDRSENPS